MINLLYAFISAVFLTIHLGIAFLSLKEAVARHREGVLDVGSLIYTLFYFGYMTVFLIRGLYFVN